MLSPIEKRNAYKKALRHWKRPLFLCRIIGFNGTNQSLIDYFKNKQGIDRFPELPELRLPNSVYESSNKFDTDTYRFVCVYNLEEALKKINYYIKNYT